MSVRSVVGVELQRMIGQAGHLTPEAVVNEARSEDSPLHTFFEWDDDIAAEKYRLVQARTLIRIVREEIGEEDDGEPKYVRAYVSARHVGREETGYLATREVLQSPVSEAILLRSLKREITGLQKKYGHLQEFGAIIRGEFGDLAS
jgi:hypothetical protein